MKKYESTFAATALVLVMAAITGWLGSLLDVVGVRPDDVQLADATIGLATLVVAALMVLEGRREAARQAVKEAAAARPVTFCLTCGETRREMPLHLRARDCSRAEVLGRMGMVPMQKSGSRFSLAYLSQGAFLEALNAIQDGTRDLVEIPASAAEMEQFAWDKMS